MFTVKQRAALADVLRAEGDKINVDPEREALAMEDMHTSVCHAIARMLYKDNPRFDIVKFLEACGVESFERNPL